MRNFRFESDNLSSKVCNLQSKMENTLIQNIVSHYEHDAGMLIPMLQDLQAECGYLPAEQLRGLSACLDIPLTHVYGVATFYAAFRLAPKGQHEVTLCMGTVCYLKGTGQILTTICEEYGIEPGETTADRLFTLQGVNCVGACALAPLMLVDGKYYDGVTKESALRIIQGLSSEEPDSSGKERAEKEAEA